MNNPRGPALVINDGTLGGLIACWAEGVLRAGGQGEKDTAPIAWMPADDRAAQEKRRSMLRRQVELCGLAEWSERQLLKLENAPHAPLPLAETTLAGAKVNTLLLNACLEATTRGITRVIWPVHVGTHSGGQGSSGEIDVEALAVICDRSLLVSQLLLLDGSHARRTNVGAAQPIKIEIPYADFNDAQLIDLALDMDAPLNACWWCLNEQIEPCGQCSQCMRWREALLAVDPSRSLKIEVLQQQTPAGV